jgi:hypothetical protein
VNGVYGSSDSEFGGRWFAGREFYTRTCGGDCSHESSETVGFLEVEWLESEDDELMFGLVVPLRGVCDPFPPYRALASWPANYPVGELADLDEEDAELLPERFVCSELEGWQLIVRSLLDELEGPLLGRMKRYALSRRRQARGCFRELLRRLHPDGFRR